MIKTVSFLLIGLAVGAGLASIWHWRGASGDASSPVSVPLADALLQRIETLETTLGQERRQREGLAAELAALRARVEKIGSAAAPADQAAQGTADVADSAGAGPEPAGAAAPFRGRFGRGGSDSPVDLTARRKEQLVAGGFTRERAEWIVQREEQLRMQAMQARYDAERQGQAFDPRSAQAGTQSLRDVLGDQEYEQYLKALGRPTNVAVRSVLASSPAQQAGLQPGDQVVGYSGQRVFNVADLNRLTLQGQPGEPVAVDVIRDGQQIQLYVPRGPLGITGGGPFRGRP